LLLGAAARKAEHEPGVSGQPNPEVAISFGLPEAAGTVLQDFVPLAESLEWITGQRVWKLLGARAFFRGEVPFRVTSCGPLPRAAALTLFRTLDRLDTAGEVPETVNVLEIGVGLGLFARAFLDQFQELCHRFAKDYYDRLCYVAADESVRILEDLMRFGTLAAYQGCVEFQTAHALAPGFALNEDDPSRPRRFHAIFLNYLLDSLPADVMRRENGQLERLHFQTTLRPDADLTALTPLRVEEVLRILSDPEPEDADILLQIRDYLRTRCAFFPVEESAIPFAEWAHPFGDPVGGEFVHSHGALQALETSAGLLAACGFVLMADYMPHPLPASPRILPDRSGVCSSLGVNFRQLEARFAGDPGLRWIEPDGDSRTIAWRMLARTPLEETVRTFQTELGARRVHSLWHPVVLARRFAEEGRIDASGQWFRAAAGQLPGDWSILWEYTRLLLFREKDYAAAFAAVSEALRHNPIYPPLWTLCGDALFYLNRLDEAETAYRRAMDLEPDDARPYYCLSFIHARHGRHEEALNCLCDALRLDREGKLRKEILEQQNGVLEQMDRREAQRRRAVAERFLPAS
jgi:tetratricopeptide (TPR) repeat protein